MDFTRAELQDVAEVRKLSANFGDTFTDDMRIYATAKQTGQPKLPCLGVSLKKSLRW
jgi:hypothetical protein